MRRTALAAVLLLALTACSPGSNSSPSGSSSDDPSADSNQADYLGPTIAEGLYTRHLTRADAERAANKHGLPADITDEILGIFTHDLAYSFKIEGDSWGQYAAVDGGEADLGDFGTFTYDEEGSWVTVSDYTGCPACVIVYRWTLEDGELTLRVVPGHDEDDFSVFVTEGTYEFVQ